MATKQRKKIQPKQEETSALSDALMVAMLSIISGIALLSLTLALKGWSAYLEGATEA